VPFQFPNKTDYAVLAAGPDLDSEFDGQFGKEVKVSKASQAAGWCHGFVRYRNKCYLLRVCGLAGTEDDGLGL
jgi:hypothetical protein